MTWEEACAIAGELPAVSPGSYHGYPALRVAGKFLTRLGDDPADIELKGLSFDERELLVQASPAIFHAPKGPNSPFFARLAALDAATLRGVLESRWRRIAPRALLRARDARTSATASTSAPRSPTSRRRSATT
jgi:hypothetical protein